MKKDEKLNEEAALNNNLDAATLRMNTEIAKNHVEPQPPKSAAEKKQDPKHFN
ncbi:hypothetical protein [Ureibacillus aquaedulcis]|uniref:Uncharacterized protein n=1 Tax=Ureibacillus aquaedulcis TaxID=3058421 RepID=A0ABT8GTT9_9BACL|nr:hypothetical protein [Ureibacillus sp. BA0131]MDN4494830.1 hypothetical protein [Ureibacillus sp. BA0131]